MTKYLNTKPGSIEEIAANMSKHQNESGYQDMFKKELEKAGKGIGAMTPAEKKAFFNKIDDKYKAKNEDIKEAVDNPYAVGMAVAKKMKNDEPPLEKSTITKAHDIAKSIKKDEKNEEISKKEIDKFHTSLDKLVHKTFGHSSDEKKEDSQELQKDKTDNYKDKNKEPMKEANYPHKMYSKDGKEVEAKTPEDHEKYSKMGYTHKNETHSFMTKDMNKSKKDAKGEKEIVDPEPKLKQESIQDAIANVWKMSAEELEKIKTEAKYMKAQRMSQYKAEDEKNKKGTADTGSKATKIDVEPKVDYKN